MFWALSFSAACGFVFVRFAYAYGADSPMGIMFGIVTGTLIAALVLSGSLRRRGTWIGGLARDVHKPLGVLVLGAALAHWHLRGRDYLGIAEAALLLVVVMALLKDSFRRHKLLRVVHKYGAYGLVLLAVIHGARALFFAGN
jgi:cytochrome b561